MPTWLDTSTQPVVVDRLGPPPSPGGAAPLPAFEPLDDTRVERPDLTITMFADRASTTLLADLMRVELGFELEVQSRRNVIEHVLNGKVAVGLVTVEPSKQERRLGARDIPLGSYEPVLVVAPSNPFRALTRQDAQAILSARTRTWPRSEDAVRIFAPPKGHHVDLLSELLIPGDVIAATESFDRTDRLLDQVRNDPLAIGVVSRDEIPNDQSIAKLEIDGFRPSMTIRVVFRNQYAPECSRLLEFWRSARGRELLGARIALR